MIFKIDFTRPHLYEGVVTLNQGNLSTNNTLRCTVVTGGNDDVTGASIPCTFVVGGKQIYSFGKVVEGSRGIVDIVFPSEALVVGENTLEFLVNRVDGSVAQSPIIKYKVWQGLTTDAGVMADSNYPLLVQLINEVNEANVVANKALEGANSVIAQGDELKAYVEASIASNTTRVDIAIAKNDASVVKAENATQQAINSATNCDVKTAENIKNVNVAIASGTQDLEVKYARTDMDGKEHTSLKDRLESDLRKGKVIEETKEGTYLSFDDTVGGLVSYLEVLGNTVQDVTNLANIRSSCIPNGDGTFKMSILSCGKNLFNGKWSSGAFNQNTGEVTSSTEVSVSDFIEVPSNASIAMSKGFTTILYDANKKKVDKAGWREVFTTTPATRYIRFQTMTSSIADTMVTVGTVATPYEEYQETRCDIKLPIQLKGVKGGKDILYYDELENAWCILRKIAYLNYSELTNVGIASTLTNCIQIHGTSSKEIKSYDSTGSSLITSKPFKHSFDDDEHMWIDSNTWKYKASIPKTIASTLDEVKAYLAKGDLFMYFWDKSPEKIVLPQSEQIKLNSFANKTHIYTISGEVDATVKATVSKSLASTVQANTEEISKINNTIADIQGLKESQDFAYETDKGYLVCKDTQNGVVKDLKIYGKSLVNLCNNNFTNVVAGLYYSNVLKERIDVNKVVSINAFIDSSLDRAYLKWAVYGVLDDNSVLPIKTYTGDFSPIKMTLPNQYKEYRVYLQNKNGDAYIPFDINKIKITFVNENVNIDSYFEGITSVGNGNKVEVSTHSKNIVKNVVMGSITSEGILTNEPISNRTDKCKIHPNTVYNFSKSGVARNCNKYYYDYNGKYIGQDFVNGTKPIFTTPSNAYQVVLTWGTSLEEGKYQLERGDLITDFVEYKEDKKTILFKDTDNTWKPVTELNEWDVLDTTKNITTLGSYKFTVKGTEDWKLASSGATITRFQLVVNEMQGNRNPLICDKLPLKTNYEDMTKEGCFTSVSGNALYVDILSSKANTVELFKTYLANNNISFVAKSTTIKECEINPIYPDSYDNETMILIYSGVVSPRASFKITSSLPNFLSNVEDRISWLEEESLKVNLANFTLSLNVLDMQARLKALETPQ